MALASRATSRALRPASRPAPRVVPRERESGIRLTSERAAAPVEESIDDLRAIASALAAATLGFEVCARRARTKDVVARMTSLAGEVRAAAEDAAARVPGGVRKASTSERMRWEWLASTAALLDGGIEGRIADEAARHLDVALSAASKIDDDALAARIEGLAAMGRSVALATRATLPSNDVVTSS